MSEEVKTEPEAATTDSTDGKSVGIQDNGASTERPVAPESSKEVQPKQRTREELPVVTRETILDSIVTSPLSLEAAKTIRIPPRPGLKREGSTPAPPVQPSPQQSSTTFQDELDEATDSLSLAQLKKLVTDMPKVEPAPYAFKYEDMACHEEEVSDLFGYSEDERSWLLRCQPAFGRRWQEYTSEPLDNYEVGEHGWYGAGEGEKSEFLQAVSQTLFNADGLVDLSTMECLIYLALGCWNETAGLDAEKLRQPAVSPDAQSPNGGKAEELKWKYSQLQMQCINENIRLLVKVIGAKTLLDTLISSYDRKPRLEDATEIEEEPVSQDYLDDARDALRACLTLIYLIVDVAVRDSQSGDDFLRKAIMTVDTNLLQFLTDWLVRSRWAPHGNSPGKKLLLLYWKTLLLNFGGSSHLEAIKSTLSPAAKTKDDEPVISASPLDYHLFRQEIISKYPAFNPPQPLFPYEPEHSSTLPPFDDAASKIQDELRQAGAAGPAKVNGATGSIIHQPIHIATPAPSPPPSPAIGPGGKGIKKQNYQTNQLFPFLYPPLEQSSNDLGGKGSAALQDLLAGRKWQGGDVPASILEAATLFSARMRATRAMKQLWQERIRFMEYDRGADENGEEPDEEEDVDLQSLCQDLRSRLRVVDEFYEHVLPTLQSLVFVLLRTTLRAATTLATSLSITNDSPDGAPETDAGSRPGTSGEDAADNARLSSMSVHEMNSLRGDEISLKAMSAILLLLLRWFKASHVLKSEYLSQLLLDSNYIQLTMKLFTHQELERTVSYRRERRDLNFFELCKRHSRHQTRPTETNNTVADHDDDDNDDSTDPDAATKTFIQHPPTASIPLVTTPPEVDELGLPQTLLPTTPITTFSWLTFFTTINHLRTLQRLLKSHPHRQLLMVQYKYSNVLKRCLKVPQSDIRLYALKIIKGQVPYYHRKWRQSNMRVITAIYLHCRPSLRDEWLAGVDVEQEVGEAATAERAVRALAYFYNVRRFPDQMGIVQGGEHAADGGRDQGQGIDGDALARDLQALQVDVDGVENGAGDDDLAGLDLGRPLSPPPGISEGESASVGEGGGEDMIPASTSTTSHDSNDVAPLRCRADSSTSHISTSSISSSANSTTSRSSRRSVCEVAGSEPDFFVRELERMELVRDRDGFWRMAGVGGGAGGGGGHGGGSGNGASRDEGRGGG